MSYNSVLPRLFCKQLAILCGDNLYGNLPSKLRLFNITTKPDE